MALLPFIAECLISVLVFYALVAIGVGLNRLIRTKEEIVHYFAIGLFFFTLVSINQFLIPEAWKSAYFYLSISLLIFLIVLGCFNLSNKIDLKSTLISSLGLFLIPVSILILLYSTLLVKVHSLVLTLVTNGNNDLGSYALQASNLVSHGFGSGSRLLNFSLGTWSRFDHPGVMSIIAELQKITKFPIYICVAVIQFCLFFGIYFGVLYLVQIRRRFKSAGILAGTICSLPYLLYVEVNGFIAQEFGILIYIVAIDLLLVKISFFRKILNAALFFLIAFLVSPESVLVSILLFAIQTVLSISAQFFIRSKKFKQEVSGRSQLQDHVLARFTDGVAWLLGIGLALICLGTLRAPIVRVLLKSGRGGVAGWDLSYSNLFSWFDLTPIGRPGSNALFLGLIIIFLCMLAAKLLKPGKINSCLEFDAFAVSALALVSFGMIKWHFDGYQSWKLFFSLSFVVIPIVCSRLSIGKITTSILPFFIVISAITLSLQMWPHREHNTNMLERYYVSEDLLKVVDWVDKRQAPVSINSQSLFINMTLAATIKTGVTKIDGPNYFLPINPKISSSCEIVDWPQSILKDKPVSYRSGNYAVIGQCTP